MTKHQPGLRVLILYVIITLVKANVDKEGVQQGGATAKDMDGCRGFCDNLDGYFCLDFFGFCQPCSQADCHSHDKSFCPQKCEDYFKSQTTQPASSTIPLTESMAPDRSHEKFTASSSMYFPSSEPIGNGITRSIIYILVPVAVTSTILILAMLHACIGPRKVSFLVGSLRLRKALDGTPGTVSPDVKISAKLPQNHSRYIALPDRSRDKLACNDYVTNL